MIEDVVYREVQELLNAAMIHLSKSCGHPPDCHLCKADLALGVAAVLSAGKEKVLVKWTKDHYNALDKIAVEETVLHETESEENRQVLIKSMFEMKNKEELKLEVIDGEKK